MRGRLDRQEVVLVCYHSAGEVIRSARRLLAGESAEFSRNPEHPTMSRSVARAESLSGKPLLPAGGGRMGALTRAHDWSVTPLGPIANWPPSLQAAVGMILNSKFPAYLVWGRDMVSFYNDAYRPLLGRKPEALGRPFREVWSEAWGVVGPIAEKALAGEASYFEDMSLTLERNGYPEETWWTFSYSPVHDEFGCVAGVLCTVHETTAKVLSERRLGFLVNLGDHLRTLTDPVEVALGAAELLATNLRAARAGYGEIDEAQETVIVQRDWTDGTVGSLAGEARILDAFGPAVVAELRAGRTLLVEDCLTDPRAGEAHAETWASIGPGR